MSTPGISRIKAVTIAVDNQDQALAWFTEKLVFVKKADIPLPGFRWVTVAPADQVLHPRIGFSIQGRDTTAPSRPQTDRVFSFPNSHSGF
jgi:hypothetical protein